MNLNAELKNHILIEFAIHNEKQLNETRSVVDGIDDVVFKLLNMVSKQILSTFRKNSIKTIHYTEKNCEPLQTFFKEFDLTLCINIGKNTYSGKVDTTKTIFKTKDGFCCKPEMFLNISAKTENDARKIFATIIGHEITHSYDLLQYAIKNNDCSFENLLFTNQYTNIANAMHSKIASQNYKSLGILLYDLSRVEQNAYIAQLRQELLLEKDKLKDSNSIYNIIKKTESYKVFLNIEKNVKIICLEKLPKFAEDEILMYIQDIIGTKFTTFNQFKKYLLQRWNKWKKSYLTKASKIAYDIYASQKKVLDGGPMNEFPSLEF